MKIRRSKQGIILEQLLHDMKHRYCLCWDGGDTTEWGSYDCGCCITYVGGDDPEIFNMCGCSCHRLIEEMANGPMMRLFLLALKGSDEMPFVPKSYDEWMDHLRPIKVQHDEWRKERNFGTPEDCCEACKLITEQEKQYEIHQADEKRSHCPEGKSSQCHLCQSVEKGRRGKVKARTRKSKQRSS